MTDTLTPPVEADAPNALPARFSAVLCVEGERTTDGREIAPGALIWRELPIPLMDMITDTHGGMPTSTTIICGVIDTIERVGNEIIAGGRFDLNTDAGRTAAQSVRDQVKRWVSIDAEVMASEFIEEGDCSGGDDILGLLFGDPGGDCTIVDRMTEGRIMGATCCAFPAFPSAVIVPEGSEIPMATANGRPAVTASMHLVTEEDVGEHGFCCSSCERSFEVGEDYATLEQACEDCDEEPKISLVVCMECFAFQPHTHSDGPPTDISAHLTEQHGMAYDDQPATPADAQTMHTDQMHGGDITQPAVEPNVGDAPAPTKAPPFPPKKPAAARTRDASGKFVRRARVESVRERFVSDKPWSSFSDADYTPEQFKTASAACRGASDSPKTDCFLRHHEPSGALNVNGVHAAAQRFSQTQAPQAALDAARAHLAGHYERDLKETPPDVLKATLVAGSSGVNLPDPLPREWFGDPFLPCPTPVTMTREGRVLGHVAAWGVCHTGVSNECLLAPHSQTDYAYFQTGEIETAGGFVRVGQLTMGCGHADLSLRLRDAAAHYDGGPGAVQVADVAAGEDEHGIWIAGAARGYVSADDRRAFNAQSLSGDWRYVGRGLELIAALVVPVPGFPVIAASGGFSFAPVRAHAKVVKDRPMALVAAGRVTRVTSDQRIGLLEQKIEQMQMLLAPLQKVARKHLLDELRRDLTTGT